MSFHELERVLRAQVAEFVCLESDRDGRMYIITPFTFGDGDGPVIAPHENGSGWVLSDEGSTMMRLGFRLRDEEQEDPEFQRRMNSAMAIAGVKVQGGELIRPVEDSNYVEALVDFIQALLRIDDLGYPDPPPKRKTRVSGKVHAEKNAATPPGTAGHTVLDDLRDTFPDYYVRSGGTGKDHKIQFGVRGATIYIRPSSPNIARIRVRAIELDKLPNSDRLLAYVEDESSSVYRHTTKGRDEYQFGQQHVSDLIRILKGGKARNKVASIV